MHTILTLKNSRYDTISSKNGNMLSLKKYDPLNEPASFSLPLNLSSLTDLRTEKGEDYYSIITLEGGTVEFALNTLKLLHVMGGKSIIDSILMNNQKELGVNLRNLEDGFYSKEEMNKFNIFMDRITPNFRFNSFVVTAFHKGKPVDLKISMSAPNFDLMIRSFQIFSGDKYIESFIKMITHSSNH